jgi:hypothetical protein
MPGQSSPAPQNLQFERQDWSLFRTVEGLQQRAGVPSSKLRRLVLKELADNGLDESAKVRIGTTPDGYYVEDDGRGIDPEKVAQLFSISRPNAIEQAPAASDPRGVRQRSAGCRWRRPRL